MYRKAKLHGFRRRGSRRFAAFHGGGAGHATGSRPELHTTHDSNAHGVVILTGGHFATDECANAPVTSVSGGAPAQHPQEQQTGTRRQYVSTMSYRFYLFRDLTKLTFGIIHKRYTSSRV
ncbi:hypothetical protein ACJJTC_012134 [Scirpophaga incertulas]